MSAARTQDVGPVARRPAVAAALCFVLGILAHPALPHRPLLWAGLLAAVLLTALLLFRRPTACSALLAVALSVAGTSIAQLYAFHYPRSHVGAFATDRPRLAEMEVVVVDPPRVVTAPFAPHRPLPPKQVSAAKVVRVRTWDGWVECNGRVLVQVLEPHPRLAAGQRVRVVGMLERPGPAMNPGQFDWAGYYREQRVLASVRMPHAENLCIVEEPGPSPGMALLGLRQSVRRLLAAGFGAERSLDHALLRALLLGDNDPELRDVQEQFRRTGTSHHLAISGMHVAVLGGLVWWVCRVLCLRPRTSAVAMTAFVVLYGAVALPSPPVVRSVLLCLAFGVGLAGRRSLDALQLLAVSVLAMLIYHPLDLYNAGFQLSFGTVLGLMVLTKPLMEFVGGFRGNEQGALDRFARRGRTGVALAWVRHQIATALAAGIVAWLVSLPLILVHFEQMNPWAVPASLALAPVVFAALVLGMLKVLLTLLWPGLAPCWAAAAGWPVAGMRGMVDGLAQLPGADVPQPAPPVWMIVAYYALLSLPLWWGAAGAYCRRWSSAPVPPPLAEPPRWQAWCAWAARGGPATAAAMVLLLPLAGGWVRPAGGRGGLRVTLLAVGAGQCAVVEPPGAGGVTLVDAGSTSLADLQHQCLGPYLRGRGRKEVDRVFLSHANYDHFSAAGDVAAAYAVREVVAGPSFRDDARGNPPAEELLAGLAEMGRPARLAGAGERVQVCEGVEVEVLWPPRAAPDPPRAVNDSSLVLRLSFAGRTVLFTGDVQEPALRALLDDDDMRGRLRADVLVAPHHGSAEPSTGEFVAAVDPAVIVSSNDRTLSLKQRDFAKATGGRPLYRTHECGAISVTIGKGGELNVETFRPARQAAVSPPESRSDGRK